MSHETPDTPTEPLPEPTTIPETGTERLSTTDALRARLRVLRHLRPGQLAVLALVVALVVAVTVVPPALTAFLTLFVGTVALLAVVPYVVVRLVSWGR